MRKLIFSILFLFILSSCGSAVQLASSEITFPNNSNKSIIYGKLIYKNQNKAPTAINLYDKKNDKIISVWLKYIGLGYESEKIFAFELPSGEYELFSYSKTLSNEYIENYWFSNEGTKEALKYNSSNFFSRKSTRNFFKKIHHDKLIVPENNIVYIGEWILNDFGPKIIDNKSENDSELIYNYSRLNTNNAVKSIPIITVKK